MRCEFSALAEPGHAQGVLSVATSASLWLFLSLAGSLCCFASGFLQCLPLRCLSAYFPFSPFPSAIRHHEYWCSLELYPYSAVLRIPRVSSSRLSPVLPLYQGLQKPHSPSFPLSSRNGKVQRGQRTLCCVFFDPLTGLGMGGNYDACGSHLRQVQEQTTWEANGLLHSPHPHPRHPLNTSSLACP